jgi:signal peptidase I
MLMRLLRIEGNSLEPEYHEGDFVFISRIPFMFAPLKPGDVIVFNHLLFGVMIKRVERIEAELGEIYVVGTHPDSMDSRRFGAIRGRDVLGKVIWHIVKKWV